MKKYQRTKNGLLEVFEGTNIEWAKSRGFEFLDYTEPQAPEPTYAEKRQAEYPSIEEQLDMQYWDQVNGTNNWQNLITDIKARYPKNEETSNINDSVSNV